LTVNPEQIRSAQFNDTYYPLMDGVVQTVHNYAEIMNRQSYSCVVTPQPLKSGFDDSVFSYDVYRTSSIKFPLAEYSIPTPKVDAGVRRFLKSKDVDILHFHSPFMEGSFATSFAKKLGIPVVATFHSKYYDDAMHLTHSRLIARTVANNIVRLYKRVDSVWACSHGTADTLRDYGYAGKIFVMDNGTTFKMPENADELKRRAAAEFNIPQDKKIILFVGHQIWHKNIKLILDSFKMLDEHSDDYRLLIVGDGYDQEEIRRYADSLCFGETHVRFLGRIMDRRLLQGIYLNAGLFFFPSVYDNSPLVVREAASLEIPSLLTEGSNAAEAVRRNATGFVAAENRVAMYREILRIFNTPGLRERVGAAARREVAKPWEEIIPLVRAKYAEVIEEYRFRNSL
jgi:glycosyltransferase involved in cell wall biosynthesis